ncbi:MAG: hypothetical protein HC937_01605, partial [Aquincola sp.]|nr:hypothetical protein [Aquincola sp.]
TNAVDIFNLLIQPPAVPEELVAELAQAEMPIEVTLEDGARPGSMQRIASRTGTVAVNVSDKLDAEVRLSTSQQFATDYSLTVRHLDGQEPNKTAVAVVARPNRASRRRNWCSKAWAAKCACSARACSSIRKRSIQANPRIRSKATSERDHKAGRLMTRRDAACSAEVVVAFVSSPSFESVRPNESVVSHPMC